MIQATLLFLSGPDMIVIAVIALFLFGGTKIPQFAKGLGESIKHFKDGQADNNQNGPGKNG